MSTLLLLLSLVALPTPAHASGPGSSSLGSQSASPLHELVRGQLDAFDHGDAQRAWSIVSPGLRERFGSADAFLQMVREGYAPLVNSQRVVYGEQVRLPSGEVGQWLDVTGPTGERVRALYLFDHIDGRWQTTGCLLFEPTAGPPAA